MAKKQVVIYSYTCDVCGNAIPDTATDATRKISYEGADFVLDVCATHAAELSDVLGQLKSFVDAGQRAGAARRGRRPASASAASLRAPRARRTAATTAPAAGPKRSDLPIIRSWAQANGHSVGDRGRIPATVIAAYDEAQSAPPPAAAPEPAPAAPARPRRPRKAKAAAG
jgi:hypothetical protein